MAVYIAFLAVYFFMLQQSEPCGLSTHIEIAHRALEYFSQNERKVNYRELLQKHPDAYQAGSVYPDAFYQGLCMQGKYHYVSEDSHWTPFLKTSINYIRRTYPLPWDQRAQKLVAFLFGIASHQVADVSWHSLHIDQGFLRAMAAIDFHGSYSEAHPVGDFGGDVVSQFELDFNYLESKWYIPVQDLFNIYKEFYNETVIDERTIVDCMYILFLQLYGEYFAVSKLYTTYSTKSPFLVERFHEYFLGGVDDMAYWSTNIFQFTSLMLDNGTSECYLPENPIFIQCNIEKRDHKVSRKTLLQKTKYYKDYNSSVMISSGADIVTTEFGVYFHMSQWAERSMELISNATRTVTSVRIFNSLNSKHISTSSATYYVSSPYSRLGWTLTTADLNQDGWDDLVIGAPGCSSQGHIQVGCVYILYGNESGLPSVDMDLNKDADVLLKGSEPSGRFGSSVAVLDFNVDGQPDLVVGAPSVGGAQLTYTGSVYIYFGTGSEGLSSQPNVTIKCRETYCNLGWTLLAADVNKDKKDDLVIGSPYAPGGGKQRGFVAAFSSNHGRSRKGILFVEEAEWIVMGEHDYAWFGFSLHSHKGKTKTLLMVGSPTWKSLKKFSRCIHLKNKDLQSIGKAYGFYPPRKSASFVINGHSEQSKMGSSFASGTLYVNGERKHVLLTGSPAQNTVLKVMFISRILHNAGTSTVYELKDTKNPSLLGTLRGDGEFSRYGTKLLLSDLDGDGLDEIIVTSPLWTGDYTSMLFGSQTGRVYIYNGNTTGLLKDRCKSWSSPCPEDWAQYVLISPEEKSRFGKDMVGDVNIKTVLILLFQKQVVVAAARSSNRARLAGAVYIYNLN
ncbi:PREDICTED: phosphatidylinositol-glycan-specific phospholipase D [Nanorana parkeri]|uniref:phosphatidylinositol-glycan-specific phospholipase D n=1 Tax=Nanorana parkeri TaxID=125878 RepID=UPI0008545016|nr:PREDICTED: phosphatidylinositol-glycan-specific phospholipase D [Nanorana parkeri]